MKKHIFFGIAALSAILPNIAFAKDDLSIGIAVAPSRCTLKSDIVFTITYTNRSTRQLAINPGYRAYEALDIRLVHKTTRQEPKLATYLSVDFEPEQIQRNLKILGPGQSYVKGLTAKLVSSLPKRPLPWSVQGRGLYLVFADSALKLPAAGQYEVTTRYVAQSESRDFLLQKDRRAWWSGKVKSPAVELDIRP